MAEGLVLVDPPIAHVPARRDGLLPKLPESDPVSGRTFMSPGELGVLGLEGVGDVLEEDETEDDVLVLGRVHVVAPRVRGGPELGLEAEVGGGVVLGFLCLCHLNPQIIQQRSVCQPLRYWPIQEFFHGDAVATDEQCALDFERLRKGRRPGMGLWGTAALYFDAGHSGMAFTATAAYWSPTLPYVDT